MLSCNRQLWLCPRVGEHVRYGETIQTYFNSVHLTFAYRNDSTVVTSSLLWCLIPSKLCENGKVNTMANVLLSAMIAVTHSRSQVVRCVLCIFYSKRPRHIALMLLKFYLKLLTVRLLSECLGTQKNNKVTYRQQPLFNVFEIIACSSKCTC